MVRGKLKQNNNRKDRETQTEREEGKEKAQTERKEN